MSKLVFNSKIDLVKILKKIHNGNTKVLNLTCSSDGDDIATLVSSG
jgi:hypothetical protein